MESEKGWERELGKVEREKGVRGEKRKGGKRLGQQLRTPLCCGRSNLFK